MSDRKLFALGLVLSTLSIGILPPYLGFIAVVISIILMVKGCAGKGVYLCIQAILLGLFGMFLGGAGIYGVWVPFLFISFVVDAFAIWMAKEEDR